jgi:hypothetical protein
MAKWQEGLPLGGTLHGTDAIARWQQECERAGAECASRVEAVALRLPWSRALRCGPTLRIYTLAGETEFVDRLEPQGTHHRYLGLLAPGDLHLVWRRDTLGDRFITVSDRSGEQRTVEHPWLVGLQSNEALAGIR